MILLITPNPLLEYRYKVSGLEKGRTYRDCPVQLQTGGKGINVSRQLLAYGIKNQNYTFIGGLTGKQYREELDREGLPAITVKTEAPTRTAAVVVDESGASVTSFFAPNAEIQPKEIDEFVSKLDKMIQNCEIVLIAGSAPNVYAGRIFSESIHLANKYDKMSILDTYGSHLEECISLGPTVMHNNVRETESSLGISLQSPESISAYLSGLYTHGVKQAFLTDGGSEFYASSADYIYKITPFPVHVIDETGSGDAFSAGIIRGLYTDEVFNVYLKQATALGALNAASPDVCRVAPEHVEEHANRVSVEPYGRKMRLVDVTPTIH